MSSGCRARWRTWGIRAWVKVVPYIEDMPSALAFGLGDQPRRRHVVRRAVCLGRAHYLVPLAAEHQYHNAVALAQAGAAVMVEEKELAGGLCPRREVTTLVVVRRRPGGKGQRQPASPPLTDRLREVARLIRASNAFAKPSPPEDQRRAVGVAGAAVPARLVREERQGWAGAEVGRPPATGAVHLSAPPVARRLAVDTAALGRVRRDRSGRASGR